MAKSAIHFYQTAGVRQALASIFKSVEELDNNHKQQVSHLYDKTNFRADKKQRLQRVLNIIKTHSVCETQGYLGICFLSVKNMMRLFLERYGKEISERCMQYLLRDLENLGFIERIETIRMSDNRQSTNIYRTKKIESLETELTASAAKDENIPEKTGDISENEAVRTKETAPKGSLNMRPKKAHFFFKAPLKILKQLKERNTTVRETQSIKNSQKKDPATKLLNFVPKDFAELFSAITTKPQEVYEYWKVTKHACEKIRGLSRSETKKTYVAAFTEFYEAIKAASKGRFNMRNPYGFYYVVMDSYAGQTLRKLRAGDKAENLFSLYE